MQECALRRQWESTLEGAKPLRSVCTGETGHRSGVLAAGGARRQLRRVRYQVLGACSRKFDEDRIDRIIDVRRTGRRIEFEALFLAEDDFSLPKAPQT